MEIKVIDHVEQLCETIINDLISKDYIDYSFIIDMIGLICSNVPGLSIYVNIISELKISVDGKNKLNNSTKKNKVLINIDNELLKIEEKINTLTIMTEYLESLIEIFQKVN